MLTHPTLEQLHALGLHGMAKGFKELDGNPEARVDWSNLSTNASIASCSKRSSRR